MKLLVRWSLTLTAAVWLGDATNAAADSLPEPLEIFLSGDAICSSARLETAVRVSNLVHLRFAIDAGTANGLTAMERASRDDWLALHCPPETTLARLRPGIDDVVIEVGLQRVIATPSEMVLSCTSYFDAARMARKAARDSAQERLTELYSRHENQPR